MHVTEPQYCFGRSTGPLTQGSRVSDGEFVGYRSRLVRVSARMTYPHGFEETRTVPAFKWPAAASESMTHLYGLQRGSFICKKDQIVMVAGMTRPRKLLGAARGEG